MKKYPILLFLYQTVNCHVCRRKGPKHMTLRHTEINRISDKNPK